MKRSDMTNLLEKVTDKVNAIVDDEVKDVLKSLLNLVEHLVAENDKLRDENQNLRDENNRLKGEQGKPNIRKQTKDNKDISSEAERKRAEKKKKKKARKKKHKIKVNRREVCTIEKSQLPEDAVFKGYQSVIVQDIKIETDNIEFKKQVFYSPSLGKTFLADLPCGYQGEFGPGIKALAIEMHHNNKMTESAILKFFTNHGVMISAATISRILTNHHEEFHQEKASIVQAGLASSTHQQMDDTSARVNGKNHYTHILCNDWYTAYFTRRRKDRLTVVDVLTQGEMKFTLSKCAYALMEFLNLPEKQLARLKTVVQKEEMNRADIDSLLRHLYPDPKKHATNRRIILEASAIAAYQQLPHAVHILLTDDAPQFKLITELLALCWVHDGRHYKKLTPFVQWHRVLLSNFIDQYWTFYRQLLEYKKSPSTEMAQSLKKEFDIIFSTKTGYDQLDERIAKTKHKKKSLLLALDYPEIPLHNNASELGARTQARYRDISFHTINEKGTQAKDTFMSIVETAKKLSVNTYHYLYDRISKKYDMASLTSLIESAAINNAEVYDG